MLDNVVYPTAEHAYQAAKSIDQKQRDVILTQLTPGQAKRKGRQIKLREDWDLIKLSVMYEIVLDKFERNPVLAHALLLTGSKELIEGNAWGDTFWGRSRGVGSNHLGIILMQVRQVIVEQ